MDVGTIRYGDRLVLYSGENIVVLIFISRFSFA